MDSFLQETGNMPMILSPARPQDSIAGTSRSLLCQSFGHHGYISRDQPYAEEARHGKLWENLWDTNWKFPIHCIQISQRRDKASDTRPWSYYTF